MMTQHEKSRLATASLARCGDKGVCPRTLRCEGPAFLQATKRPVNKTGLSGEYFVKGALKNCRCLATLFQFFYERRNNRLIVGDDSVVAVVKELRIFVVVDCHDEF